MNDTLSSEIEALTSIYGEQITIFVDEDEADGVCVSVSVPRSEGDIQCTFRLGREYPAVAPSVELEGLSRDERCKFLPSLRGCIAGLVAEGGPMLFQLVEFVRGHWGDDMAASAPLPAPPLPAPDEAAAAAAALPPIAPPGASRFDFVHGEVATFNKSSFQAHVCRIGSGEEARAALEVLLSDPRLAKATHNISAFRIVAGPGAKVVADSDDDGEDAAGGRLAHLLELKGVENALVVVSRWFGGVLLGPVRFKLINDTARRLIDEQPWYKAPPPRKP